MTDRRTEKTESQTWRVVYVRFDRCKISNPVATSAESDISSGDANSFICSVRECEGFGDAAVCTRASLLLPKSTSASSDESEDAARHRGLEHTT